MLGSPISTSPISTPPIVADDISVDIGSASVAASGQQPVAVKIIAVGSATLEIFGQQSQASRVVIVASAVLSGTGLHPITFFDRTYLAPSALLAGSGEQPAAIKLHYPDSPAIIAAIAGEPAGLRFVGAGPAVTSASAPPGGADVLRIGDPLVLHFNTGTAIVSAAGSQPTRFRSANVSSAPLIVTATIHPAYTLQKATTPTPAAAELLGRVPQLLVSIANMQSAVSPVTAAEGKRIRFRSVDGASLAASAIVPGVSFAASPPSAQVTASAPAVNLQRSTKPPIVPRVIATGGVPGPVLVVTASAAEVQSAGQSPVTGRAAPVDSAVAAGDGQSPVGEKVVQPPVALVSATAQSAAFIRGVTAGPAAVSATGEPVETWQGYVLPAAVVAASGEEPDWLQSSPSGTSPTIGQQPTWSKSIVVPTAAIVALGVRTDHFREPAPAEAAASGQQQGGEKFATIGQSAAVVADGVVPRPLRVSQFPQSAEIQAVGQTPAKQVFAPAAAVACNGLAPLYGRGSSPVSAEITLTGGVEIVTIVRRNSWSAGASRTVWTARPESAGWMASRSLTAWKATP